MSRTFDAASRWTRFGTELMIRAVDGLDDDAFATPSLLPGWSRAHVTAHVAANAEALSRLVHWAATGECTPMYPSPEDRAAGIEQGRFLPAADLNAWLRRTADALENGMAALGEEQWRTHVVTAQGRTVPATEVPWLRSREVCVHAVDLATGVTFADLPADFLTALCDDVVTRRAAVPGPALTLRAPGVGAAWDLPGDGEAVPITGELHDIAAYLTGRDAGPLTADGAPLPALDAWL
ncbi:maleylpyruvate isomerase family mycothiol-dependent enzyme [Streptomyces sp. NPDC002676]